MSYAISVMFFGWSGKIAYNVLRTLLGKKHYHRNNDNIDVKALNKMFEDKKLPLKCDIFAEGTDAVFYIYIDVLKNNTSDNDEDIGMESFTIKEIKDLFGKSLELKKEFEFIKQPRFISLIVAESK